MRAWFHVPAGLGLPLWAQRDLRQAFRVARDAPAGRPLDLVCFGIVDLETTGFGASQHRILEIGLVVFKAGQVQRRFSTLIDVEVRVPPWIAELTGIDASVTRRAPGEAEAIARFEALLRR